MTFVGDMSKLCNYLPLLLCLQFSNGLFHFGPDSIKTEVISGVAGKDYSDFSVNSSVEYLFQFRRSLTNNGSRTARITVDCQDATRQHPVLVVLRQASGVLSWQLPLIVPTKHGTVEYVRTSRTLCPNKNYPRTNEHLLKNEGIDEEVIITISTSSQQNIRFLLRLDVEDDFSVSFNESRSFTVSPSEPRFYEFSWSDEPSSPSSVVLHVESDMESKSDVCMVVSIQNISCPVFDLERTVQFEGQRQTVTKQGGMTLTRSTFPKGFYIVFVVKGDDSDCSDVSSEVSKRLKHVKFSFQQSIGRTEYILASMYALLVYLSMYIIAVFLSVGYYIRKEDNNGYPVFIDESVVAPSVHAEICVPTSSAQADVSGAQSYTCEESDSDESSLDEIDVDYLFDAVHDKDVIRTKSFLCVSDLARKNPQILRKKSLMYFWNLLTVAIFYVLPVVQLVISSQLVLNQTGNEDLCYYNFLCSYPVGFLSDFNHVFSNIGYVLLGFLFVILVHRRDRMHHNATANRVYVDKNYGIPQHYGLFYAMGAALIMEGVLSGCYHVCPNHSNFQFDSSFMYVIALLSMLKIYHSRHPDINASACATFGVLALIILVGVAGILSGSFNFWILFTILHLTMCFWLSGKVYYMGRLRFDLGIFRRTWNVYCQQIRPNPCSFFKPKYPSRMVLLILGNMANWAIAALGWVYHVDTSFGTYLLSIFMTNLMLYTIFYIAMKLICHEKILPQPAAYLILATLGWGFSLYFFVKKAVSWQVTPAQSRTFNAPCLLLNFYDRHDVWHFLSAFSMFFSFMTLFTLDDDLVHVLRSQIPVF